MVTSTLHSSPYAYKQRQWLGSRFYIYVHTVYLHTSQGSRLFNKPYYNGSLYQIKLYSFSDLRSTIMIYLFIYQYCASIADRLTFRTE